MERADGAAVPPSSADRSHRSSISSMCARCKEIKRVKPKRTASFFTRQFSHGPTSYSAVQAPAESLEQG
ncbi:FERM domain-containing protein 8 [Chelonia mydas]|uniref:FERM domain-containing protein 8 n=1 Tax=Chelonia mydas TaxID=8469 RepID=M7B194_CHEMY|nr:FERM domain-containing protein 8 [Chelonia mydas]